MPNNAFTALTDNPQSEGTYRMYLQGHGNEPVMIPFSKVPGAQNQGFKFNDDMERYRWRKDYDHDVRRLPLFSQARWDAENATFPDDFLDNTVVNRAMDTISRPFVHPVQTARGVWALRKPLAAGARFLQSYGSDLDSGREFLETNPATVRLREMKDDYDRGGVGYAVAKAGGDIIGGAVAGEVGGVAGKVVAPQLAKTMGTLGKVLPEHAVDVINKTMGAGEDTLEAGNPGRAYLHESDPMNVSSHWKSVEQKAKARIPASDKAVQAAADEATTNGLRIPASEVKMRLQARMGRALEAAGKETFPVDATRAVERHWESLQPYFDRAEAQGGFTPSELWKLNDAIAKDAAEGGAPLKELLTEHESDILKMLKTAPGVEDAASDAIDLRALQRQAKAMKGKSPSWLDYAKAAGRAGVKIGNDLSLGHGGYRSIIAATLPELPGLLPTIAPGSMYASGVNALGRGLSNLAPRVVPVFPNAFGAAVGTGDGLASHAGRQMLREDDLGPVDTPIPETGPARWVANGATNMRQHLAMYPTGLSTEDILQLAETPAGQRALINAGDLTPGSKGMHALVTRISHEKRGRP